MKKHLLSIFALLLMAATGAMAQTITVTWNNSDITGRWGETFTKGGVTVTAQRIDFNDKDFAGPGTFTTTLGNFTKIEVTASNNVSGAGWSGDGNKKTWTGNASSVSFSGDFMGFVLFGGGNIKFVFTIEGTTAVNEVKADGAQVAGKKKFFKDGKLVIEDANGNKFNTAGAQMK